MFASQSGLKSDLSVFNGKYGDNIWESPNVGYTIYKKDGTFILCATYAGTEVVLGKFDDSRVAISEAKKRYMGDR